jgi:hypothetical protein
VLATVNSPIPEATTTTSTQPPAPTGAGQLSDTGHSPTSSAADAPGAAV